MMKIDALWTSICAAFALIGATVTTALGGWSAGLSFLITCMIIDYVTGFLVAYVFHKSPKTKSGTASSKIGFQGILKKGGILLVVYIAYQLENVSQTSFIRDGAIIAYIVNELTSIIENLGIMGVPLPDIVKNTIDILKKKETFKEVKQ